MSTALSRLHWKAYRSIYDALWDNELTTSVAEAVHEQLDDRMPVDEIGAGTGLVTQRLVAAGLHVTAVEPDDYLRRRLQMRCPAAEVSASPLKQLCPPRTRPRSVVAVNVAHFLDDPQDALDRLRRRAGEGGQLVVVTPSPTVSLTAVALAQRALGVPRRRVLRFLALHIAIAPLTIVLGASVRQRPPVPERDARVARSLHGVSRLLVFDGIASEVRSERAA